MTLTRLYNTQGFFELQKNDTFQLKNIVLFLIFAQSKDYGYTLKPPQLSHSNEYTQSMF